MSHMVTCVKYQPYNNLYQISTIRQPDLRNENYKKLNFQNQILAKARQYDFKNL